MKLLLPGVKSRSCGFKRRMPALLLVLLATLLNHAAHAQILTYENDGIVNAPPDIPPNIDAINFVNANQGQFIINFTNDLLPGEFYGFGMDPYTWQNTQTYSNLFGALMACNTGFRFDTFDPVQGRTRAANTFFNAGTIECGTPDTLSFFELDSAFHSNTTYFVDFSLEGAICTINAKNIFNRGLIHMGFESFLSVHGDAIDLQFGSLASELQGFSLRGNSSELFFNGGVFDGYWGIGDPVTMRPVFYPRGISPAGFFGNNPPSTHGHDVIQRDGTTLFQFLGGSNFVSYVYDQFDFGGSNRYTTVAFLANTNPFIQANLFFVPQFGSGNGFGPPDVIVEYTNLLGTATNNVYVEDVFGITTNFSLVLNGLAGQRPTLIPFNYFVGQLPPVFFFGTPETSTPVPPNLFPRANVTNQWSGYQALLVPTSLLLGDVANQNFTNVPGGIKIVADQYLNLSNAHIASLNYLLLQATNHFDYGPDAQIQSPAFDLNLRSTNGLLQASNLISSTLQRPEGLINLFSARWTNFVTNAVIPYTNHFHVFFADAQFSPVSHPVVQDLTLRAQGKGSDDAIVINDYFAITHNLLLDAARITIATNNDTPLLPSGVIDIRSSGIVWPTVAPRLQYFTNNGVFKAVNTVFFGGARTSPYYTSTFTEPYRAFVNAGSMTNYGSFIEADEFICSGPIVSSAGSINVIASDAIVTNAMLLAPSGSVTIASTSLIVSNTLLQTSSYTVVSNQIIQSAGGPITLTVSHLLDDGTLAGGCPNMVTNKNFWNCSGLNLPQAPSYASLLSTTVTNFAFNFAEIVNTWAGPDLGTNASGFTDHGSPALGHLILDSRDPAAIFTFKPAGTANALYVDSIDFMNYATNSDSLGNLRRINIMPGMKIYYAQARIGGLPAAEKLNGANNGRFVWVRDFNCGPFSSVTLTNPADNSTYTLNQGLRESCFVDSDLDGIPNCLDATPVPLPASACPCSSFIPAPLVVPNPSITQGTGSTNSSSSASAVLDAPALGGNGSLKETVVQNAGVYSGLFYDTNAVSPASAGAFTAAVNAKGAFTGKLSMNGKSYSFGGIFDAQGNGMAKASRGPLHALTLNLRLALDGANQVAGTITDSRWTAALVANRAVFNTRKNPATQYAGKYNLDIPGDAFADHPAGDGFATVNVDAGGAVQLAGSLGDGTKLALKSSVDASGNWPFYSSLYQGAGCALGWLQVTNHTLAGRVIWIKPAGLAGAGAKSYTGGFTNRIQTMGLRYQAPAPKQSLLNWNYGNLILTGAGLARTNLIFINDQNRLTSSDDSSLKLSLTPSSGLFQGSLFDPDSGKRLPFQGALFQDMNVGLGYFLNSEQSGLIYLGPAP